LVAQILAEYGKVETALKAVRQGGKVPV
jgi:hypothetical protein